MRPPGPLHWVLAPAATAVLALGLAAPALVASAPSAAAAGPSHASVPSRGSAGVTVQSLSPALVGRDSVLRVNVRVQNTGFTTLDAVGLRLRVATDRLGTRAEVQRWLGGTDAREGAVAGSQVDLPRPLVPGGATTATLEVPGAGLGLPARAFGTYGAAVEVRAAAANGLRDRVALHRTTVQWQGGAKEYASQGLAWIVPFTGLPGPTAKVDQPTAGPSVEEVAAAVGPGSRLRRLLDAATVPGVAWAVDPALLRALQRAAAGPTPTGATATPTTPVGTTAADADPPARAQARDLVRDYLADLRAGAAGRELFALPFADPDVDVLSRARDRTLVRAVRTAAPDLVEQVLGIDARTDLGWPASGYAADAVLRTWRAAGATSVVLDAGARPLNQSVRFTPDARTRLPHRVTGLLADPELSGLLARLSPTDAAASARFLALTAASTTELPGVSRRLLVAAPRTFDPDPAAFRALVTEAARSPWLRPLPVASLLTPPADPRADTSSLRRRAETAPSSATARGLRVRDVAVVTRLRQQLSAVDEVLVTPQDAGLGDAQLETLGLLSSSWRGHLGELAERQDAFRRAVDERSTGIRVLPTTVNFLATQGRVQITVSNELAQPVQGIRLRVTATNPRLRVERGTSEPRTIAPGQRTRFDFPVRALASGLVTLDAQLVTPSDAAIGAPQQVQVRVRPTDSWLLTAVGVVIALVVVVGLVRSLRRPRRGGLTGVGPAAATGDEPGADPPGNDDPTAATVPPAPRPAEDVP